MANRLGANSLLSAIYGGTVAGPNAIDYISNNDRSYTDMDESIFEKRKDEEQERFDKLLAMRGTENAYKLPRELGDIMPATVTVVRDNEKLFETDKKIVELMKRFQGWAG